MPDPQSYEAPLNPDRRIFRLKKGPAVAGVPARESDIEQVTGLHWIAKLFRVLSALLVFLMAMQVFLGITSTVEISVGVLTAEAIRLVIFAGLLWGAGDLSELFVKSHRDLRASRILLGRLTNLVEQRGQGDETH